MRVAFLASTAILASMASGPAFAQNAQGTGAPQPSPPIQASPFATAPAAGLPAAQEPSAGGLEEVIVTAQRTAENLQRAAVAVDVVQGNALTSAGITEPERLGELVPALTVQGTASGNIIFIRGVGNFTLTPNSDPSTAFNYDGVYVGRPTSTSGTFYDLERIEVLKGPQGTLYGRNATAGAINVLPKQPVAGEFSGYGTVSYGNYNALTAEAAINIPMGDRGALRVSGNVVDRKGYLKDGTDDEKVKALRVQMKAELTPSLTVRVSGDYSHIGGLGGGVSYINNWVYNRATGQFTVTPSNLPLSEGVYTPAAQAYRATIFAGTAARRFDSLAPLPFQDSSYYGANAEITYHTGIGTLTVIPAFRYANVNIITDAAAFIVRTKEKDQQSSLEGRLVGHVGFLDYNIGALYFDEQIRTGGGGANLSYALSLDNGGHIGTRSYAGFARLTAHLTDQLRLVGGIRYTHDSKHSDTNGDAFAIVCTTVVNGVPSCPNAPLFPSVFSVAELPFPVIPARGGPPVPLGTTGAILARSFSVTSNDLTEGRVTYRAAAEFDVAARSLAYASVETGFRSGGFNAAVGHETYQPEYITAYTLGLKNRFLDNRLQLNLEAFYWKYRDQQISHVGLDALGRTANFNENIGRSTLKGVEVEGRAQVTPTTLVSGDVQYLDSKYDSFQYNLRVTSAPPFTTCPVQPTADPTVFTVNCSGFPAYNSPKWTVNLGIQQTIPLGGYKLVVGGDTQFKSSRFTYFDYQEAQHLGSTWLSNAQIVFSPSNDRWSIAGYVRNIEGNRIIGFAPTVIGNFLVASTSAPRTYGVRVSAKF